MKTCNFKSRKAVSTIIGTFFFVIVMAGAFTAFILMMQTNTEFLNTQLGVSQNEIQKIQGQFTIAASYDASGDPGKKLCVSVKNSGSTPLEIADLFIVNKTNNVVTQHDIDFRDAFVPVSSIREILTNQQITLRPQTTLNLGIYDIKVVSTSGITQTVELKVFATSSPDPRFNVTAFAYPANAPSGVNVTVGMHVFNRMNTTLLNVQPVNGRPSVDPSEAVTDNNFPLITNLTISRLDPNENALFMWDPEILGGVGSKLTFTLSAKAQVEGCTTGSSFITSEKDLTRVKIVPGVKKVILASPESFISFPSPFGQTAASNDNYAVFSLVMQNPTSKPFTISQVAIQIINPDGADVIRTGGVLGVLPTVSGWSQNVDVITWKGTPVSIGPFDMKEFVVRVKPKSSMGVAPINSIIYNVYSSFGQFSKGPFTFGILSTNTALVNVYAQNSFISFESNPKGGSPVFSFPDVVSGTTKTFHFTITNNGSASVDSPSDARAYLLINIPPGLRNINDVSTTPGTTGLSTGLAVHDLIEFEDGSKQKAIELTSALAVQTARTYSMTATMPTISVPAHYIFTLTANGTSGNALLGPSAEIDVQVCPTSGCP